MSYTSLVLSAFRSPEMPTVLTTVAAVGIGVAAIKQSIDAIIEKIGTFEEPDNQIPILIGSFITYATHLGLLYALPMILNKESMLFKPSTALITGTLGALSSFFFSAALAFRMDFNDGAKFIFAIGSTAAAVITPTVARCL